MVKQAAVLPIASGDWRDEFRGLRGAGGAGWPGADADVCDASDEVPARLARLQDLSGQARFHN